MLDETEVKVVTNEQQLNGISGWLLLFVIGVFLSAVYNFAAILIADNPFSSTGGQLVAAHGLLLGILALATGIMLTKVRNKNSILAAQIYLAAVLAGNVFLLLFIGLFGLIGVIGAIISNIIWQTYFLRSRRVKATYNAAIYEQKEVQINIWKSLSSVFDRKKYGINYFIGIGFFLLLNISWVLWLAWYPLIYKMPFEFPPISFFLEYQLPLTLLYSVVLVLLLHTIKNDWLVAISMGLCTALVGILLMLLYTNTKFGRITLDSKIDFPAFIRGFTWSFFIVLGMVIALKTQGLKWWSFVLWTSIAILIKGSINDLINSLTLEYNRVDFLWIPMSIVDSSISGLILFFSIYLHLKQKGVDIYRKV